MKVENEDNEADNRSNILAAFNKVSFDKFSSFQHFHFTFDDWRVEAATVACCCNVFGDMLVLPFVCIHNNAVAPHLGVALLHLVAKHCRWRDLCFGVDVAAGDCRVINLQTHIMCHLLR